MLILAVGDIIGRPGRQAVHQFLPELQQQYRLDLVIANAENVEKYRDGKTQLFGFFVGQVMKATDGMADPELTGRLVRKYLDDS